MNLLLLEPSEIGSGGSVELADRRAEHLRGVLRAAPGRTIRVGVIDGGVGSGRVVSVADGRVALAVDIDEKSAPDTSWVDLIVALPRPAVLHRVLQTAAAMGVGRLVLLAAWRVEKSFFSSPALREEAIRKHLLLGAEQGMTTRLPQVEIQRLLVPFVREIAGRSDPPCRLLAHPEATVSFESAFSPKCRERLEIAIGPEGGWIEREVETFRQAGFAPFSMGSWTLRVEAAVTAALAQAELLRRLNS